MISRNATKTGLHFHRKIKYPTLSVQEYECGIANIKFSWAVAAVSPATSTPSLVIELNGPRAEIVLYDPVPQVKTTGKKNVELTPSSDSCFNIFPKTIYSSPPPHSF